MDILERIMRKVKVNDFPHPVHPVLGTPCWEWQGYRNHGYGRIWHCGKYHEVHRVALERAIGKELGSLQSLHHCDNPPCCNPEHLFPGTHDDNMADLTRKGRRPKGDMIWTRNDPERLKAVVAARKIKFPDGTTKKGQDHASSKLKEKDVLEILSLRQKLTQKEIGKIFGVTSVTISKIFLGKLWSHFTGINRG